MGGIGGFVGAGGLGGLGGAGGLGTGGVGGLGGAGGVAVADAGAQPMPDFHLLDENAASITYQQPVSPRDYLTRISAWYFGHST